jgi:hypothetical protein
MYNNIRLYTLNMWFKQSNEEYKPQGGFQKQRQLELYTDSACSIGYGDRESLLR